MNCICSIVTSDDSKKHLQLFSAAWQPHKGEKCYAVPGEVIFFYFNEIFFFMVAAQPMRNEHVGYE